MKTGKKKQMSNSTAKTNEKKEKGHKMAYLDLILSIAALGVNGLFSD